MVPLLKSNTCTYRMYPPCWQVMELVDNADYLFWFLPAYGPGMNPIEEVLVRWTATAEQCSRLSNVYNTPKIDHKFSVLGSLGTWLPVNEFIGLLWTLCSTFKHLTTWEILYTYAQTWYMYCGQSTVYCVLLSWKVSARVEMQKKRPPGLARKEAAE